MENLVEVSDVFRRASLLSLRKSEVLTEKPGKEEEKPKDAFFLVHILFLLFGLLYVLPLTFFITANGYWMYKFRDTDYDTVDSNNKTTLQKYFVPGVMIAQAVPMVVCILLSTRFGHRFRIRPRIITTLTIIDTFFAVFTCFIKINTDTWQTGFFAMTLGGLVIIVAALMLFQVTAIAVIPKFPPLYMKTFLLGQGMSGIFNITLQIISLAIGTSAEASALVYFIAGTLVIMTTLILYILSNHLRFFRYYANIEMEDTKKRHSRAEIIKVFKDAWSSPALFTVCVIPLMLCHPCISSLVVSENYGNGSDWNDKYFVPVTVFLFTEIASISGRLTARGVMTKARGPWMVAGAFVVLNLFVPLIMFCNVQPRSHLAVLFPHDWQFILILTTYSFMNGHIFNTVYLSIPRLSPGNEEVAYLIMMACTGTCAGLVSPLSLVTVRLV